MPSSARPWSIRRGRPTEGNREYRFRQLMESIDGSVAGSKAASAARRPCTAATGAASSLPVPHPVGGAAASASLGSLGPLQLSRFSRDQRRQEVLAAAHDWSSPALAGGAVLRAARPVTLTLEERSLHVVLGDECLEAISTIAAASERSRPDRCRPRCRPPPPPDQPSRRATRRAVVLRRAQHHPQQRCPGSQVTQIVCRLRTMQRR